jgi:hypothetical protein
VAVGLLKQSAGRIARPTSLSLLQAFVARANGAVPMAARRPAMAFRLEMRLFQQARYPHYFRHGRVHQQMRHESPEYPIIGLDASPG